MLYGVDGRVNVIQQIKIVIVKNVCQGFDVAFGIGFFFFRFRDFCCNGRLE